MCVCHCTSDYLPINLLQSMLVKTVLSLMACMSSVSCQQEVPLVSGCTTGDVEGFGHPLRVGGRVWVTY